MALKRSVLTTVRVVKDGPAEPAPEDLIHPNGSRDDRSGEPSPSPWPWGGRSFFIAIAKKNKTEDTRDEPASPLCGRVPILSRKPPPFLYDVDCQRIRRMNSAIWKLVGFVVGIAVLPAVIASFGQLNRSSWSILRRIEMRPRPVAIPRAIRWFPEFGLAGSSLQIQFRTEAFGYEITCLIGSAPSTPTSL